MSIINALRLLLVNNDLSFNDNRKFPTHQLPACLNFCLLDETKTYPSDASYFVYGAFMSSWHLCQVDV